LLSIVLTEAFGCDRCQQIFVVDEKNQEIELVSSPSPAKRLWRWNGYRWRVVNHRSQEDSLPTVFALMLMILLGSLFFALHAYPLLSVILGIMMATTLLLVLNYVFWLVYRR
jgi:hypothetical protein